MKLLIIEDHLEMREAIARRFRAAGSHVDVAGSIKEAKLYLENAQFDVVVLDRMLPDGDSIQWLADIRLASVTTPVLLLTAKDQIQHRVDGFEAGADDYLIKPFAIDELVARVRALSRRQTASRPSVISLSDLVVDTARREVRRRDVLIPLRPKEYTLLELFMTHLNQVVFREQILNTCWDQTQDPSSNVEEVLIASLRRKLGKPALIKTVRGSGYLMETLDARRQ